MERKIRIMPDELAAQIAAGEVVERPASIVKELVENAIDAGATEIVVDLEKGGKKSIRVTDNGSGIARDEVALAFCRHATSKIHAFDDMYRIRSLGFRGEALHSIAAIAAVEMYTKTEAEVSGTRIVLANGTVQGVTDAGCPRGTSLRISRIFAATPVRMKFLKSDATELGHCVDAVVRCAMAHPEIKMSLTVQGKKVIAVPRTESRKERIALILGDQVERQQVAAKSEDPCMELSGFVSLPRFTMSNARGLMFYVNDRYVKDGLLHNAVMAAYRRIIEPRRYPSAVLFLAIPPEEVDVNVHPTKREVRFRNPSLVFEFIAHAVADALSFPLPAEPAVGAAASGSATAGADARVVGVGEPERTYTAALGSDTTTYPPFRGQKADSAAAYYTTASRGDRLDGERSAPFFSTLRYLGRVAGTYLLFLSSDALVVIDQHAAHERILFEKLRSKFMEPHMELQRLLLPEVLSLSPAAYAALSEQLPFLNEIGFEAEPYGPHAVIVKAVPALLAHLSASTIIPDIIDELAKAGKSRHSEALRDTIAARLACRGAVKAGESLAGAEIERLCRDLDETPFAASCPHGRPVFIVINTGELERLFKR